MKKILYKFIACLLIPSFVFAQPYPYRSNENSIKQTDLFQLLNALDTEVGKEIVTYVETTVGSIDLEQAKAFTTAQNEIGFVPIKSFSKVLAALCYRQLEDGAEYLFLITYNATQKSVAFTFPSGRIYVMKSSKVTESINPGFQFQEYDDLQNKVSTDLGVSDISQLMQIIGLLCGPALVTFLLPYLVGLIFGNFIGELAIAAVLYGPFLFIVIAYLYQQPNLEIISILFAVYIYGCALAFGDSIWY
jgi:hypothetical protein